MARRTRDDLDAELLLRLANRDDVTETQRLQFLHDAYLLIANEFPHPEMEGIETAILGSGTSGLLIASTDFWWPMLVKDMDNNRLIDNTGQVKIEKQEITPGVPTEYYWFGGTIYMNREPTVDLTVKVWYKKNVPELAATGSPLFNRIFDPLIPMKAAELALDTVGNQEMAHIQATAYGNYVSRMNLPKFEHERNDRRKAMTVRIR